MQWNSKIYCFFASTYHAVSRVAVVLIVCSSWIAFFVLTARFGRRMSQVQIIIICAHNRARLVFKARWFQCHGYRIKWRLFAIINISHIESLSNTFEARSITIHILVFKYIRPSEFQLKLMNLKASFKNFGRKHRKKESKQKRVEQLSSLAKEQDVHWMLKTDEIDYWLTITLNFIKITSLAM